MGKALQTRVLEPIERNLQEQADLRGISLYRYLQMIMTEVGRGNVSFCLVVPEGSALMPIAKPPKP
ncbi:hypothetical protein GCM10028895_25980 [Pontibacter rugosus]